MSHMRITLPIVVDDLVATPTGVEAISLHDYLKNPDTAEFRFRLPEGKSRGPFDPWQLRNDFLGWPVEHWSGFFEMAGTLGTFRISMNSFAEWQRLLRRALLLPAREWKGLREEFDPQKVAKLRGNLTIRFEWDGEAPTARLWAGNALNAIIATVQVDALQGAQFRVCARQDCKNPPFRVEARHKIFCCSDCAHLVAVRNDRKRKAEAKSRAGKKATKRK
jgi:hypothetical protein